MRRSKPIRIILDTNVWISFLISNTHSRLDHLFYSDQVRVLLNEELLSEIQLTIQKPKLLRYFDNRALEEMLLAFEDFIVWVDVSSQIKVCRDPKDDFLLCLALDGKADYLLTGDKDLLTIDKYRKTKIRTVSSFLTELRNKP